MAAESAWKSGLAPFSPSVPSRISVFSGSRLRATNTKCRPSGRNSGKKCATSPREASSSVTGFGAPPEAGTETIGVPNSRVKRIVPSRFQEPPNPLPLSQIVRTGPPPALVRFNFPSEKNAMSCPSGDHIGYRAQSVPGRRRISRESRDRVQIEKVPPTSLKLRRTWRPFGARAIVSAKICPGGGAIEKRTSSGGLAERRTAKIPAAPNRAASAAVAQAIRSRLRRRDVTATGGATPAVEPSAIQRSSRRMSAALCQRSSGSFARQVRTTRSRAIGDIGCSEAIDGGSDDMIAVISEACVAAENAFFPVAISYRTAPSAKMSVRASASLPSSCSGAMY